jgi:hypothetical protein
VQVAVDLFDQSKIVATAAAAQQADDPAPGQALTGVGCGCRGQDGW